MLHFYRKSDETYRRYKNKEIDYNSVYDFMEGWMAYAQNANTYDVRKRILSDFEEKYSSEISNKEVNRILLKGKKGSCS